MKKLIFLLALLFSTTAVQAQKADIRYNLKVGREYTQNQEMEAVVIQSVMGMNVEMAMDMNFVTGYNVKSHSGGVYDIEVVYKRLKMSMDSAYGSYSFDSEDKNENVYTAMKDASFRMKMDEKGNILEISGMDKMIDKIAGSADDPVVRAQLENTLGEETFKNNFKNAMIVFPDKAVSPGDRWTSATSVDSGGISMDMETVYEYVGKDGGLWVVRGASVISTPAGTKIVQQGMEMDVAMKGDAAIEMRIDSDTGWTVKGTSRQNIDGDISAEIPMQGTMKVVMKMINTATISGTK